MARIVILIAASLAVGAAAAADDRWTLETYASPAFQVRHRLELTQRFNTNFSVSQGFSVLSLGRTFRSGDWTTRLGAGPLVTQAEATLEGPQYDQPYRVSGAGLHAAASWRFPLNGSTFLSLEAMFSAARANPVLPGPHNELSANNIALHAVFGVGFEF